MFWISQDLKEVIFAKACIIDRLKKAIERKIIPSKKMKVTDGNPNLQERRRSGV
jgi:hypothetical protein